MNPEQLPWAAYFTFTVINMLLGVLTFTMIRKAVAQGISSRTITILAAGPCATIMFASCGILIFGTQLIVTGGTLTTAVSLVSAVRARCVQISLADA